MYHTWILRVSQWQDSYLMRSLSWLACRIERASLLKFAVVLAWLWAPTGMKAQFQKCPIRGKYQTGAKPHSRSVGNNNNCQIYIDCRLYCIYIVYIYVHILLIYTYNYIYTYIIYYTYSVCNYKMLGMSYCGSQFARFNLTCAAESYGAACGIFTAEKNTILDDMIWIRYHNDYHSRLIPNSD